MKPRKTHNVPLIIDRRHVDPERRIVLMGAAYQRADRPRYLSARLACPIGAKPMWVIPGWVGVRERFLSAHGFGVAWFTLDIMCVRQDALPGANGKALERYQRFVREVLEAGYNIEWQRPPGQHYGDRASFERAATQDFANQSRNQYA